MLEAAVVADWKTCIEATFDIERSSGIKSAAMMRWRGRCDWTSNRAQGRRVDASEARLLYEVHRVWLTEAVHEPEGVDRARAQILTAIDGLREYGFPTLASDLEDLLRTASRTEAVGRTAPEAEGRPQGSQGTAFLVNPEGVLLTAFHVIGSARTIAVTCPGYDTTSGVVVQSSAAIDVAVVKTPLSGTLYLDLVEAGAARLGDLVFTLGFPVTSILGREAKFADGAVSALSGPNGDASLLQVTVPVQPGNSGGPLVNIKGQVVGVFTASAAILPFLKATGTLPQNINWAVKTEYARPLFAAPPALKPTMLREEAIERAKKATCLIESNP
jgi:S1-C subfamily serine protease